MVGLRLEADSGLEIQGSFHSTTVINTFMQLTRENTYYPITVRRKGKLCEITGLKQVKNIKEPSIISNYYCGFPVSASHTNSNRPTRKQPTMGL